MGTTVAVIAESREKANHIAIGMGLPTAGSAPRRGKFDGHDILLTWARGHCLELQTPDEVHPSISWSDPSSLLPLPKKVPLKPKDAAKGELAAIGRALKECDEVWIATDPDREGEAIGWEILEYHQCHQPVKRIVLDRSLSPEDIRRAIAERVDARERLGRYYAQQSRAIPDWYAQYMVRAYTALGRSGRLGEELQQGKGRASVFPYGRVQAPTLRMIVERERAIREHRTQTYYRLHLTATGLAGSVLYRLPEQETYPAGIGFDDRSDRPLILDRAALEALQDRCQEIGRATAEWVQAKNRADHPPLPHSLTSLQRSMNKAYKMSSSQTLAGADALRLAGYLTYPRTEHGELPVSMYSPDELKPLLRAAYATFPEAAKAAGHHVLSPSTTRPKCFTEKPMEHHGIIPTERVPDIEALPEDQQRVYRECVMRFAQALLPPAEVQRVDVALSVDAAGLLDEHPARFTARIERLVSAGWRAHFERQTSQEPISPPAQEASLAIEDLSISEHETQPPKPFTEDTLLAAMRNADRQADGENAALLRGAHGIGTPATRHTIIEKLRSYESITAKLRASPKGEAVIDALPETLSSVVMTAEWEREMGEIALLPAKAAAAKRDGFVDEQRRMFTRHLEKAIEIAQSTPAKQSPDRDGPPTQKMLAAAKKIATARSIRLPKQVRESFQACRSWLDERMAEPPPPTPKMLDFARRLAGERGERLPAEAETSFEACKAWLDQRTAERQASPKMLKYAQDLAEEMGIALPEGVETFAVCKAFLDEHQERA